MLKKSKPLFAITLSALSSLSFAAPVSHVLIAPTCLVKSITAPYKTLSTHQSFMLIESNEVALNALMEAKHVHRATPCGGFMDVTSEWQQAKQNANAFLQQQIAAPKALATPQKQDYRIQHQAEVETLLKQVNPQATWTDLSTLTAFENRYADSENGIKAAKWIKQHVLDMANSAGRTDVTAYLVKTTSYQQPSVVVKVGNANVPGIVIGGHMDTLNGRKPGADDDGSGTVTVLSVARTVLSSGMQFKKPIYFIWYAAEEEGLFGSKSVVAYFKSHHIPVEAAIQFDMTGYAKNNDRTMWLINDYVNKDLTNFLHELINTYVKQPVDYTRCGYACSDHASWNSNNVPAAFPFEASFGGDNPYIHSSNDVMEHLSLDHINDFAKLGVSFAVELAEPTA